jgi:thioredoxin-like negative regulator of GroEL
VIRAELQKVPVAILVFSMKGCPACRFYLPVFQRVAARYGKCVPAHVVDVHAHAALAAYFKVSKTPTTVVVRHGRRSSRPLGMGTEKQVEALFRRAMKGQECTL